MLNRTLAGLVVVLAFTGALLAEETRGSITKIEDGSITIRALVVRFDKDTGKSIGKPEEKTFKIGKDLKIVRVKDKRTEDVQLTLADLKTAVKVAKFTVAIVHEGENCSAIKVLPAGKGG